MNFVKFLKEGRSVEMSKDEVVKKLKKNCSNALDAYNKGKKLFRGYYDSKGDYLFVDPKQGKPRKSAYAKGNYYTLLMDNLPSWKQYPKRSQSLIMSSSHTKASEYTFSPNTLYIVFPYDGSKIGVAPEDDIFFSFNMYGEYSTIMGTGNIFSDFMNEILKMAGSNQPDSSWSALKNAFSLFDKKITQVKDEYSGTHSKYQYEEFKDFLKKNYKNNMLKMFDSVMNPIKNKFRLTTDITKIPASRECWTDGKCIMVNQGLMETLFDGEDDDKSIINKILDVDETDDTMIDFVNNVKCEQILYMDNDMRSAYLDQLQKHVDKMRRLPKTQPVWELDKSNKRETNNGLYRYMAIGGSEGCIATVRSCFLGKNTVDVEVTGTGPNPYSIFGDRWKFLNKEKYKNLEEFSDDESLDYDKEVLEDLDLI